MCLCSIHRGEESRSVRWLRESPSEFGANLDVIVSRATFTLDILSDPTVHLLSCIVIRLTSPSAIWDI
jgi:hypothetical protein